MRQTLIGSTHLIGPSLRNMSLPRRFFKTEEPATRLALLYGSSQNYAAHFTGTASASPLPVSDPALRGSWSKQWTNHVTTCGDALYCLRRSRSPPMRGQDRVHLACFIDTLSVRISFARNRGYRARPEEVCMLASSPAPTRHIPVHPNLDQLRHQAKDLLAAIHSGSAAAVAEFQLHYPFISPSSAKLAHAQLTLARSYGIASWPRLVTACKLIDAIWNDDLTTILALVKTHPKLLHEDARAVEGNWGPPLSYAANLGRDRIIAALHSCGATDNQHAFGRACLQGQLETARLLLTYGAQLVPGEVMGPCETLSDAGLKFLLDLGAPLADANGDRLAPVALILQTYSRKSTRQARLPRTRTSKRHRASRHGTHGCSSRTHRPSRTASIT